MPLSENCIFQLKPMTSKRLRLPYRRNVLKTFRRCGFHNGPPKTQDVETFWWVYPRRRNVFAGASVFGVFAWPKTHTVETFLTSLFRYRQRFVGMGFSIGIETRNVETFWTPMTTKPFWPIPIPSKRLKKPMTSKRL